MIKRIILSSIFAFFLFAVIEAQVEYIAHRGESYLAPENTSASAKLAWKLKDDAVEIDIHMSVDKKLLVIHDGNTKRTSGQDFSIKDSDSEDLRKLDVGSFKSEKYKGEKIPYLEEIIKTIPPGKKLVVEIKCSSDALPVLKNVVRKCKKQHQLVFIAFDWQTIVETKRMFPENPCYWLSSDKTEILKNIDEAAFKGLDGLDLRYSAIDQEIMDKAKQLKLDVWAWTVDDPGEAKRLINLGVTAITSNRPNWLESQIVKE